jgi:hypothetical protein
MAKQSNYDPNTFFVDSRFQRMARRPGGLSREEAIKRAETEIQELKPEFIAWLELKLKDAVTAVRQIEGHSGDASRVDLAHQYCRELRDVGTTMGFALITTISDNLCEILVAIKAGAEYHKETLETHIDALILTSKPPYSNLRADQLPEMTDGLRRTVERASIAPSK